MRSSYGASRLLSAVRRFTQRSASQFTALDLVRVNLLLNWSTRISAAFSSIVVACIGLLISQPRRPPVLGLAGAERDPRHAGEVHA